MGDRRADIGRVYESLDIVQIIYLCRKCRTYFERGPTWAGGHATGGILWGSKQTMCTGTFIHLSGPKLAAYLIGGWDAFVATLPPEYEHSDGVNPRRVGKCAWPASK